MEIKKHLQQKHKLSIRFINQIMDQFNHITDAIQTQDQLQDFSYPNPTSTIIPYIKPRNPMDWAVYYAHI